VGNKRNNRRSDTFALGMIMLICSNMIPAVKTKGFNASVNEKLLQEQIDLVENQFLRSLISGMLELRVEDRLSYRMIFNLFSENEAEFYQGVAHQFKQLNGNLNLIEEYKEEYLDLFGTEVRQLSDADIELLVR